MPTRHHLVLVARKLRVQLGNSAFLTIPRTDITRLLRDTSGEDATRIKSQLAHDIELALLGQGVGCFPSLVDTTTGDDVRLFHSGSVLANLIEILVHPSTETDSDLGAMLSKIKGKWRWATPTGPAAVLDALASSEADRP